MRMIWVRLCVALATALSLGLTTAAAPMTPPRTVGAIAQATQVSPALNPDPEVLFGVLPNGLRYAIRHGSTPQGQIAVRFQILAGSMQEGPGQLGYAHIVEHMAFRGATHLEDGEYVRRMAALGASFGADVNAFTNPLNTTYRLDLPRGDAASLDTAFFLMREVASEVAFKPEMLDAERGVILAEERAGATIGRRAGYAANKFLFEDHPYARPVLGTVESIGAAKAEDVRRFYDAYYRPERALLVIVGEVDPKAVEARIRTAFSDWQGRGPAGADPAPPPIVPSAAPLYLYSENGLAADIRLVWRAPLAEGPDSRERQIARIRESLAVTVLANRVADATQAPGAAFQRSSVNVQPVAGVANDVFVDVNALMNWKLALNTLYGAIRGVTEGGVGADELDRAISQRRIRVAENEARAPTRSNLDIAQALLDDIGAGRVYLDPAQRRGLFDAAVDGFTPEAATEILRLRLAVEPRMVITSPAPIPGAEQAVREQVLVAKTLPVMPVEVAKAKAWPYTDFGPAGHVAEQRAAPAIGAEFVRFENGVRLTVKPTKYRADEILVNVRFGDGAVGWSRTRVEPERALWLQLLSDGGLADFTTRDRSLFMNGKVVSRSISVTDDAFVLSGVTRPADLDTQLQLFAADLTASAWRADNFEALKRQQVSLLMGRGPPQAAFRNRESAILRSDDPRWTAPTPFQVSSLTYDKVRAFGEAIIAKGPLEVIVVGDVDPQRVIEAVAKTLGALPPRTPSGLPADAREVRFPDPTPDPISIYHSGRADQGLAVTAWPTTDFWGDPKTAVTIEILREVVRQRLMTQVRSQLGQTYSPSVTSLTSTSLTGYGVLAARVEAPPDKMGVVFDAVDGIAADLAKREISADEFAQAANPYIEAVNRQAQTNIYWLAWLQGAQDDPRRVAVLTDSLARARSVTPADIRRAAQAYLVRDKAWRGQIIPDPISTPSPASAPPRAERAAPKTP